MPDTNFRGDVRTRAAREVLADPRKKTRAVCRPDVGRYEETMI